MRWTVTEANWSSFVTSYVCLCRNRGERLLKWSVGRCKLGRHASFVGACRSGTSEDRRTDCRRNRWYDDCSPWSHVHASWPWTPHGYWRAWCWRIPKGDTISYLTCITLPLVVSAWISIQLQIEHSCLVPSILRTGIIWYYRV